MEMGKSAVSTKLLPLRSFLTPFILIIKYFAEKYDFYSLAVVNGSNQYQKSRFIAKSHNSINDFL